MANYLTEFNTMAEYQAATLDYPNVSVIKDENNKVIYAPTQPAQPVYDYKLYFNVTDPSEEYLLFSSIDSDSDYYLWGASELYVDDVLQPAVTNTYRFPTAGEHTVGINVDTEMSDANSVHMGSFKSAYDLDGSGDYTPVKAYKIEINDDLTAIEGWGFCGMDYGRYSGTVEVVIGDSVTSIGDSILDESNNTVSSISIGTGVTSIGDGVFYSCTALSSVTISDSITSIGESAFDGCYKLSTVTIGSGVTSIGSYAFFGIGVGHDSDPAVHADVYINATTPPSAGTSIFGLTPSDITIYVPASAVSAYKSAWTDYESYIEAMP